MEGDNAVDVDVGVEALLDVDAEVSNKASKVEADDEAVADAERGGPGGAPPAGGGPAGRALATSLLLDPDVDAVLPKLFSICARNAANAAPDCAAVLLVASMVELLDVRESLADDEAVELGDVAAVVALACFSNCSKLL